MSKNTINPETLPAWNLKDFYASPQDPKIQEDLDAAATCAREFSKALEGHIATLSAKDLAEVIEDYEKIDELLARLMSYAYLLYAENMGIQDNAIFLQSIKEKVTDISQDLLFFTLEMNDIEDEALDAMLQENTPLQRYTPWIRQVRAFKPYQLSKDLEKILHEKDIAARSNWIRLYDETFADMRFTMRNKEYPISDMLNFLSDADATIRKDAALGFAEGLKKQISLFTLVTNTLAKSKEITDRWRTYPTSETSRHLDNQVEEEVVDALMQSVKQSYPNLSHRYYQLKARWMGAETMPYWDRNAPLPQKNDQPISWDEGRDIVLDAYQDFSPEMARLGQQFFDNNWIDGRLIPGKDSGAFSHPTVPSVHPYILINYYGKVRDVMTLAHELGHGVHQCLAGEQGHLLSETPLTIAETASVFGEMLTFQSLMRRETDPEKKRILLAGKVEDMLNTVVRQIAFFDFERQVHAARKEKELSSDELGEIWMNIQRESLGSAVELSPEYQHSWSYISHFIHAPFYVYAYAFGDCLVNSLYAAYTSGDVPDFEAKYLDLLRAGGTKRHDELVKPFGLDTRSPDFWNKGLSMIAGFIDELETLS